MNQDFFETAKPYLARFSDDIQLVRAFNRYAEKLSIPLVIDQKTMKRYLLMKKVPDKVYNLLMAFKHAQKLEK